MTALIVVLLTAIAPLPAQSAGVRPSKASLSRQLEFVEQHRRSMRAAVGLWSLRRLMGLSDGEDRVRIGRMLRRLADDPETPLPVRRLALRQLAERLEALGRDIEAAEVRERLGWVRDWWFAGPFDDQVRDGFERVFPPERRIDLDGEMEGKRSTVSWRRLPHRPADGLVRLHPLMLPNTGVVAYALAVLHLQRPRRVLFHAGCDDACKVWVNGQQVLADPGLHPLRADQRCLSLKLPAGANRVLVKVVQGDSEMGFALAVTDPEGRPLPGLRSLSGQEALEALDAPAPREPGPVEREVTLADWFLEQASARPDDPGLQAEAGWALYNTAARDQRDRRAEQFLALAVRKSRTDDPNLLRRRLLLARVIEIEDDNRSRQLLEQAAASAPGRPEAWGRLGLLYQVRGEVERALAAHARALEASPVYLPSLIGRAELYLDLGLDARAERRSDELVQHHPDVPEVLTSAASLYRRLGDGRKSKKTFERLVALDARDELGLRALHELALESGELTEALEWLERLQARDPLRVGWWLQRGQLLQANGRSGEALAALQSATDLCPADPQPWVIRGEVLFQLGRTGEALADWQRALALAPQDHQLKRRIQAKESSEKPFYEPWMVDARTLGRTPSDRPDASGAERLVDLHVVRLHPNGMASRFHQQLVRIADQQGAERFRTFRVEYAPGRQEVRVLDSRLWRPDGRVDTSVLTEDFSLSQPWYNLYYDVHAREITFPDLGPGDVVELSTLIEDTGGSALLSDYFGDLVALQSGQPVRESLYVLLAPGNRRLAFNSPGGGVEHEVRTAPDGTRIHTWRARNLPGVEPEPAMPGFTETHVHLHLSTMPTWAQLARWFGSLISDQLIPGPEVHRQAASLTEGLHDPMDEIRAIYRFVADGTRYVGLEFGIHSYVPYRASQVLRRKFGDCKDKSALLVALFEAAGIPARLALVRMQRLGRFGDRGDSGEKHREPASLAVFNHAICYLPDQGLWLDGTATLHDILDLPAQDQGVQALVIGPEGERLIRTPRTGPDRNWTELHFDIQPGPDGRTRLDARLVVSGSLAPQMRIRLLGGRQREEVFGKIIGEVFPGARVDSIEVLGLTDPARPLEISARLEVPDQGEIREGGLEVPALGKDTSYQRMLASMQTRKHDLLLGPAWAVRWRVDIRPPPGLEPSGLPAGGKVESPYGRAEISFDRQDDLVSVKADFALTTYRVSADQYPDFRSFLGRVDRLFSKRIRFSGEGHAAR